MKASRMATLTIGLLRGDTFRGFTGCSGAQDLLIGQPAEHPASPFLLDEKMKQIMITCPLCNRNTIVKRETYDDLLASATEWYNEDITDVGAIDNLEDIKNYENDKEEYEKWYYSVTPDYCIKCKQQFYYDEKAGTFEFVSAPVGGIIENLSRIISETKPANGYIYFLRDLKNGMVKIGCSKDVSKRKKGLESTYAIKTEIIATYDAGDENIMYQKEREIHLLFMPYHQTREWFFLPDDIIDKVKKSKTTKNLFDSLWAKQDQGFTIKIPPVSTVEGFKE